jgi:hypothetical protein
MKGEMTMTVQASEVRELIEQVRGSYGYDFDTGERVDLEHGIPEQYGPILSRMEAGGEMSFDEEWRFVEAYSFFCRKHERSDEFFDLLHKAQVRLIQNCRMQAYWDGDGRCHMILPKAAEHFMRAFPEAVRIMPAGKEVNEPDEKRLAVAMEWELDRARRSWERVKDDPGETWHWRPAPDVNWKTITGKWLIKRFEIAD